MSDFFDNKENVILPKARHAFQEDCTNSLIMQAGSNNFHKMQQIYNTKISKIFNALIKSSQKKIYAQFDDWNPSIFTQETLSLLKEAIQKNIQVQIFIRNNSTDKSGIKELNKIAPHTVLTSASTYKKNFIATEKKVWADLGSFSHMLTHDPFLVSYLENSILKNLKKRNIQRYLISQTRQRDK